MTDNPSDKVPTPEERMAQRIKEAREYAARYDLDIYLHNPGEMSHWMLKMYELTSQLQRIAFLSEKPGRTKSEYSATVKKYGNGKFVLYYHHRGEHDKAAHEAFSKSADLHTIVDHSKFVEEMRIRGATTEAALQYLEDYYIDDQCYGTTSP